MATVNYYLFSLITVALLQGLFCEKVDMNPKYKLVQPGESVTVMCKVNSKIQYCRFQFNGERILNLGPNKASQSINYFGNGFDKGECGAVLTRAENKHNGLVICTIGFEEDTSEVNGTMILVISRTPSSPDLQLRTRQEYFKEGDRLDATCTVAKGRPISNLTWYLGNTPIYDGLSQEVFTQQEDLHTIKGNISHVVEPSDDGKELKCVADHPGLKQNSSKTIIRVKYQPKPLPDPIEHFGLVEGVEGRIAVVVNANPQPKFIWYIGDKVLNEADEDGRFLVLKANNLMNGSWESVLIINPLSKGDVEQQYSLIASNDIGETRYRVLISTSPRPKVLEIGTGMVMLIILGILLLTIVVVVVLYARSRGAWCFSGGDAEKEISQPEGTENPAVTHHASSEYINNSPELKKERPKEDTPV